MKCKVFLVIFLYSHTIFSFDKISYSFSHDPIDAVIVCHYKDSSTLNKTIESVRAYVVDIRRIIVVSAEPFTDAAEWFDESLFPFSKEDIALEIFHSKSVANREINKKKARIGWLYQQFLKLYAPLCIPDISSNVLIVDADVFFLKKVLFLQKNGAGLYAVGTEHHTPYFVHAKKLLPGLEKVYKQHSGIVHHMLFQKEVIEDFFHHIYEQHHTEPWKALARLIAKNKDGSVLNSAMSEYELYFNFVFARTDQVKIRHLRWCDAKSARELHNTNYDFVAIHNRIS